MGTLRLYELVSSIPTENLTAFQVGSEAIYRSEVYGKLAYDERIGLIIRCDTAPFDFKTF